MRPVVTITLGGRDYPMAPTFDAANKLEQEIGAALPVLRSLHAEHRLTMETLGQVVLLGLQSAEVPDATYDPHEFTAEHIAKRLFEMGISGDAVRGPVTDFLDALCYTPEHLAKKRLAAAEAEAEFVAAMSSSAS
ncbi:MAG: GTA-gp10 family protein [Pseudomonadota bacterium]